MSTGSMLLAGLFALAVVCAGFGVLRLLGLGKGASSLGLAASAGVSVLGVACTWSTVLRAPPVVVGLVLLIVALAGVALAVRDRAAIGETARIVWREQRFAAGVLLAAIAVPAIVMSFAFAGVQVPLSPHDGAAHTETIQADRLGQATLGWYPPALAALFAAWLDLFPWVDSAKGAFELGMSLPPVAALAVFGLGVSIWHDLRAAALAALLLGFTYLYPYFPQLWSGWPLALSLILVIGMWSVAIEYLEAPSARWAALGGLLVGAIVVMHGTELYTLAIILPIVLVARLRLVRWGGLAGHAALAAALAVVCAAVYVPVLFNWAGAGGAYSVGIEDAAPQAAAVAPTSGPDPFMSSALGSLGIDLPLRVVLLAIGIAWAFARRLGRSVVVIGLVFAAITTGLLVFSGGNAWIRQVYAAVFPWGMHYRIFMIVALAQVLVAGAGGVAALDWWRQRRRPRVLRRAARLLFASWVVVMTWASVVFLAYPTGLVLGYGPDDDLAMNWLREHATAGAVVVNDGYADAGIWTPYKAGLPILLPRAAPLSPEDVARRKSVMENVGRLTEVPGAVAAACDLGVRYVYRGSRMSEWDARGFPPLDDLRAAKYLRQVFASGDAVVFAIDPGCLAATG